VLPPDSLDCTSSFPGGRRKIIPSSDLLEDCYTSDGTTTSDAGSDLLVGRRTTAARRRTRDGDVGKVWSSTSVDNESLKTPDSLLTSELLDDSVFDGELDLIGALLGTRADLSQSAVLSFSPPCPSSSFPFPSPPFPFLLFPFPSPSRSVRGLGERCKFSQRGPRRCPGCSRILLHCMLARKTLLVSAFLVLFRVQNGGSPKSAALFGRTPRTCLRPALLGTTSRVNS